ncbi:Transcriptional regulator containing HTH domain,ArsR family [Halanaeroarchaeum sp. HSR-CO]|nr:Transcriptional regulator containing HTH domain,ArsR family [Halanaeroarchaeum sp. HSR-CO]
MTVFADPEAESRTDSLAELPPSAKLVFKVLEYEAPLTQSQLRERTRLTKRTTRHALSILTAAGVVIEEVYLPDARMRQYRPVEGVERVEDEVSVG